MINSAESIIYLKSSPSFLFGMYNPRIRHAHVFFWLAVHWEASKDPGNKFDGETLSSPESSLSLRQQEPGTRTSYQSYILLKSKSKKKLCQMHWKTTPLSNRPIIIVFTPDFAGCVVLFALIYFI